MKPFFAQCQTHALGPFKHGSPMSEASGAGEEGKREGLVWSDPEINLHSREEEGAATGLCLWIEPLPLQEVWKKPPRPLADDGC